MIIAACILLTGIISQAAEALLQGQMTVENVGNATVDEQLWATWGLETLTITTGEAVQTYTLAAMLTDRNLLPADLFLSLYFFDDKVGVCSSGKDFFYEFDINVKGSFTANRGQLTITLYDEQPRVFEYVIENGLLKLHYTQAGVQFDLIYKLTAQNLR